MSAITIFTTGPQCIRCKMTKHAMDKKGVPYTEINIREDLDAATYVTEDLGYSEAPVVVVDEHNHWSGFRPDLIDRTAAAVH